MLSSAAELAVFIFSGVGSSLLKYFGPNKIKIMSAEEKQIKKEAKAKTKHHKKTLNTNPHFFFFLPSLWKWQIRLFIPFVCFYTDK